MDLEFARQLIEQYGYLAVFVSTVIEGEVVVLAAAALSSSGLLEAHWVIAAAAMGAFVGHILLFAIGRWRGMQIIEAVPMLRRHYPKANLIMDRYANYSVFVFQYLYGMRLISAMLFGCSTISLPRFLLLESINCIIWSVLAFFAGHLIGMLAMQIFDMVGLYGLLLAIALLALAMLLLYHRYGHHHVRAFLSSGRDVEAEQLNAAEGRHFALEQLDYHMALAARNDQPLSLLLLKLPHESRKKGGELKHFTRELCAFLRLADIPARFARDTFAVVAPNTDLGGAERAVHRLIERFAAEEKGPALSAMRVGVVQWQPD